jgi:hypothetical protein
VKQYAIEAERAVEADVKPHLIGMKAKSQDLA